MIIYPYIKPTKTEPSNVRLLTENEVEIIIETSLRKLQTAIKTLDSDLNIEIIQEVEYRGFDIRLEKNKKAIRVSCKI